MLRVLLHSGHLSTRNPGNLMATMDIAYTKQEAWADYSVAFSLKGTGAVLPDEILGYPRWAGSVWDLVARGLTRILYREDQAPASPVPDRRCAYATRMCAVVERSSGGSRGVQLGTVEISQVGNQRGVYTAIFKEDILGDRGASFTYGLKSLVAPDLLLRAICWAYFDKDVLGARPALILPASIKINGVDQFDANALPEPAKTGFARHRGQNFPATCAPAQMAKAQDYVAFLMRG
jgi:hypothetical protein